MNTVVPTMSFPHSHARPERWPSSLSLGVRLNDDMILLSRTTFNPRTACISPTVCSLSCTAGSFISFLESLCFLLEKCLVAVRGPSADHVRTEPHRSQVLTPSGVVVNDSLVPYTALCIATCNSMASC